MKNKIFLVVIILMVLIISGCANSGTNAISYFDGVPRNEQDDPLLTYHMNGIVVSEHEKQQVYNGNTYISSVNINLTPGETYDIAGHTDGRTVAMDLRGVTVDDLDNNFIDVDVDLWENVEVNNNGSSVSIFNLDRNMGNNNTFAIFQNSTVNYTSATHIPPLSNIIKSDQRRVIITNTQDQIYIMKEETSYSLRIVNNGAGSVNVRFRWIWHEDIKVY